MLISVSHIPIVKLLWINFAISIHCVHMQWHTLNSVEHGWEKGSASSDGLIQNIPSWNRTGAPKAQQFQQYIYFLPFQRNRKGTAALQHNVLQKFRGVLMRCHFFLELSEEV